MIYYVLNECKGSTAAAMYYYYFPLQYLRSVIDGAGMYNLNKQNQWNNMEDLLVFATMTSDRGATLDPRLKVRSVYTQILFFPELFENSSNLNHMLSFYLS